MISSSNPVNILIVDDNQDILNILQEVLVQPEINIITTNQPTTVLELCISAEISIALIDVNMPTMSGFDLLNQLKANPSTQNIVVILMTGYSMSSEEVFIGLSSGAVDYLFKPLDLHITNAKVNSLVTLVAYQRDIQQKNTKLKDLQDDLHKAVAEAQKGKASKENFLANMSHEIRTPLNAIVGITNLLKSSELNPVQQEMIRLMEFSSTALLEIVNDVLESFQIDAGKLKIKPVDTDVVDMIKTVGETMRPLALEKGLLLDYGIVEQPPGLVKADPLRLNQILMNLLNNAIKFTSSGKVEIVLTAREINESHALLEFRIKDTGIGIQEDALEKIFERFEQVEDKTWQNFGGTGLGLSIVKRLAELMGGKIEVESAVEEGTTFIFTSSFELADRGVDEQKEMPLKSSKELSDFDNISVLLVEDNVINQFVAVKMMQSWKLKVDVAENGLQALDKLKDSHYDIILMDIHMPVMNGIDSTRHIRSKIGGKNSDIPIICFSASVIEHERQEAVAAGVDDFLEKPFHPEVLHGKIRRLLARNSIAPER